MVNAEIIAVGSELLLGQIANTNAQFISQELAALGIDVYYHTAVGDNRKRLENAIATAQKRADILIFCGGLGPTKDDLTKDTIAAFLGRNLVTDETALARIQAYFEKRQQAMTENNKKQAVIIEGSRVLENRYGMAPGMALQSDGQIYMLLPGPPRELQPMFSHDAKAYLAKQLQSSAVYIGSRVLRFFGIGESRLETDILDLIESQTNPTIAPLAGTGEVTLRLTAKSRSPEEAHPLLNDLEATILERIGPYFYGYGETTLAREAFHALQAHGQTIACAESLTGGRFAKELTDLPDSSAVFKGGIVCYTNEVKENVLGIDRLILQNEGAVSERCAARMAENARRLTGADIGISFTGVAGPEESEGKEAGTVYVGLAFGEEPANVYPLHLAGERNRIRMQSAHYGFYYLLKHLTKRNADVE